GNVKDSGISIPTTPPTTGQVLTATSPTTTAWETGAGIFSTKIGTYDVLLADSGSTILQVCMGADTFLLPSVAPPSGWSVDLITGGFGSCIVNPNGLNINGAVFTHTVPVPGGSCRILSDGNNYFLGNGPVWVGTAGQIAVYESSCSISSTSALPNGITATTQTTGDNTTKLATTAFVTTAVAAVPATLPGGSSGDIQYNSGSSTFAGSAATITSAGSITIPSGQVASWN